MLRGSTNGVGMGDGRVGEEKNADTFIGTDSDPKRPRSGLHSVSTLIEIHELAYL